MHWDAKAFKFAAVNLIRAALLLPEIIANHEKGYL
jgi:hypothetical protein